MENLTQTQHNIVSTSAREKNHNQTDCHTEHFMSQ